LAHRASPLVGLRFLLESTEVPDWRVCVPPLGGILEIGLANETEGVATVFTLFE